MAGRPASDKGPGSGGRRAGAGRKPTHGANKATIRELKAEARGLLQRLIGTKRDPLMVAIRMANDESLDPRLRLEAVNASLKFIHPTLSAVAVQQQITHTPADSATPQLLEILSERLSRLAAPATPASQPLTITSEPINNEDNGHD